MALMFYLATLLQTKVCLQELDIVRLVYLTSPFVYQDIPVQRIALVIQNENNTLLSNTSLYEGYEFPNNILFYFLFCFYICLSIFQF